MELLLLLAGVLCVGYLGLVEVQAAESRRAGEAFGLSAVGGQSPTNGQTPATVPVNQNASADSGKGKPAAVMGRLEIPSLAIRVPIMADYETGSLLRGVGHIPGTAMPGGLGTLGLAGHRDTYFRPLRNIKPKMDIRVADKSGTYHYLVDSTEIVTPEQVEVLDIGSRPTLTLITCYPFYYVGSAPKRFIVHAHLLSALPDGA